MRIITVPDTVPDSVTTVPDSVTEIGTYAFYNCTGLTEITIPDNVTSIGASAFRECTALTEITIPESVTSIGAYAFSGCTCLTAMVIPDSVVSIGRGVFSGCSGLTNLTLPFVGDSNRAASDPDYCPFGYIFGSNNYSGSTQANQNRNGVTSWDFIAYLPTSLTSVTITIGDITPYAFKYCSKLTSISVPNATCIGEYAFYGCTALTSLTVGESITSIGAYAFYGCTALTEITIPESVTSIGEYAFNGCSNLTGMTFENPEGWWYSGSDTATSGTDIAKSELSDPAVAASKLKNTYFMYYLKRMEIESV